VKTRVPWRQHLTVACLLAAGCGTAPPATHTGVLQRWEGDAVSVDYPKKKFRWRVERCGSRLRSEWRDASGTLVAWDEVNQVGAAAGRYDMVRLAPAQTIRALFHGREILVDSAKGGGNSGRQRILTHGEAVAAGAMMISLVQEQLRQIRAGETLERSYLVATVAAVRSNHRSGIRPTGSPGPVQRTDSSAPGRRQVDNRDTAR
jgi:hypothetical protein